MKKSLLIALVVIMALTMTLFAGCGGDGGEESANGSDATYSLKMGGVDAPDDVSTMTMDKFAELVNEKTDGAVVVETYPAGQLGNYDEMYQEIKKGNLEAGLFTVYGSDTNPAIEILYLPYATKDMEDWLALTEAGGDFWNEIEAIHAEQGVKLLGLYNNGFLGLAFAKLSETPEEFYDFSAKKNELLRVPGMESMQKSAEGMGFSTTVMPYTDVYTALQTGTVDGAWSGGPTLNYYNFRDVIHYFVDLKCSTDVYCMVMNQEMFDGMPEEYQAAIEEAGLEACAYGNELQEEKDSELLGAMEEEGITVYVPDDQQRSDMQSYFVENVWPEIVGPFNQDLVKSISNNL